jgi:SAM-dependent methyltransferase
MQKSPRAIVRGLRRSIAQRGLPNTIHTIWRRITRKRSNAALAARDENAAKMHIPERHPFDEAFGVETSGEVSWRELETGHAHDLYTVNYYGVAPSLFHQSMMRWQSLGGKPSLSEYTFIDLGSGKGRPVLLAAEMPFKACIGVELNPGLSQISADNMALWKAANKARSPMTAICQDVTEFDFPSTPCLVFLFNPFSAQVLKKVIRNIARVFAARPGELDLIYINSEFSSVLAGHPGFELLWEERMDMSSEDAAFDLTHQLANAGEIYGQAGSEVCSAWRWRGMPG